MKDIITTTSNRLEGYEIIKYYDIINTHTAIGVNYFADLEAAFTDIFGGKSKVYENRLEDMYNEAIDNLRRKALLLGADAIININIDFDEVSGKGKSMLMVNAFGTPVKLHNLKSNSNQKSVSYKALKVDLLTDIIIDRLKNETAPDNNDWSMIFHNNNTRLCNELIVFHLKLCIKTDGSETYKDNRLLRENLQKYLKSIDYDVASNVMYNHIKDNSEHICKLMVKAQLFDPTKTLELINEGLINIAIASMKAHKNTYYENDFEKMEVIAKYFKDLPDKGKYEDIEGRKGKSYKQYTCPNGHENKENMQICAKCGLTVKGFTKIEANILYAFEQRINALKLNFKNELLN